MDIAFVSINYNPYFDPVHIAIIVTVLTGVVYGVVYAETRTKDRDIKLMTRIFLYPALVFSCYFLLYVPHVDLLCGVEIINNTVKIYHEGCGLIFLGKPCVETFSKSSIINITVVDWSKSDLCKPTRKIFGTSTFSGYRSGFFETTCGTALIQSVSTVNIVIELKDRYYKIIIGPKSREELNILLSALKN